MQVSIHRFSINSQLWYFELVPGAGEFVAGFIAIRVVALVCSDADGLSDFTSEMLSAVDGQDRCIIPADGVVSRSDVVAKGRFLIFIVGARSARSGIPRFFCVSNTCFVFF